MSGKKSSLKHGYFGRSLNSVKIVFTTVTLADTENAELFRDFVGAVGTFGVTTLLEIRLREAQQKYMQTTYHPGAGVDEAIQ